MEIHLKTSIKIKDTDMSKQKQGKQPVLTDPPKRKATLVCDEDQLHLIQRALDFYSRIGIGQFKEIIEHPSFQENLYAYCSPNKEFKVGDQTMMGEIVEIAEDKSYIKTKGSWGNGEEIKTWTDFDKIRFSPDYNRLRALQDTAESYLIEARHILYGEVMHKNGSWGIYNPKVHQSCRDAYEMIQVIRHEFWKLNPDKTHYTVDSNVDTWIKNRIEVKIEDK